MGLRSLFAVGALVTSLLLAPAGAPRSSGVDLEVGQPQALQDDEVPDGLGVPLAGGDPGVNVPVLMYHYIRVNPKPRDRVGFSLSVTPATFHAQMDYLARNNFHVIRLGDAAAAIRQHGRLPSRPVVLTFDDGYADFFTTAVPELRRYGFTATDYVVPGFLGQPRYMTWDQVKQLDAMGFTIGAHTMHHRALAGMSRVAAQLEMSQSKQVLEKALGHPVIEFAYPYGSFNGYLAGQARAMGFESAASTIPGTWHQPGSLWYLTRQRVSGWTSLTGFARLVGGPTPH
jgi:peptidoglycan/xylan/chitin deacetylase (PgdA/CDA1 family)